MYVSKELLLSALPEYRDQWRTVKSQQEVSDIISEMIRSHGEFEGYYDKIGSFFIGSSLKQTCRNLYNFCKENIRYREEPDSLQTVSLPTGILTRGYGDCKAYASFIAGCLGAIERETGEPIDWHYCFASYKLEQRTPYHVFVVVEGDNGPIWVDPTPGSDGQVPVWMLNQTVPKAMALVKNIAGLGKVGKLVTNVGAVSLNLNVAPGTLPLPANYPAGLPQPYIKNGLLRLTPVPPNFSPNETQIAFMMLALQLWVYKYSENPYDLFSWNSKTDGSGINIAIWVRVFCEMVGNPAITNYDGSYKLPSPFAPDAFKFLAVLGVTQQWPDGWDFLRPPEVTDPTAAEKLTKIVSIAFAVVLQVVKQIFPGVGSAFASQWQNLIVKTNMTDPLGGTVSQTAEQLQAAQAAAEKKKKLTMLLIIGALLAGAYFFMDE